MSTVPASRAASTAGIAAMHLRAALAGVAARGKDPARLLATVGLSPEAFAVPEARIPLPVALRLWREAAALVGDPWFGLRAGAAAEPLHLGVLGYAILSSPTVGAALDAARRYERLMYAGFSTTLRLEDDAVVLRHAADDPAVPVERQPIEFALATIFAIVRHCVPGLRAAQAVRFRHAADGDVSPYVEVFGVVPAFGADEDVLVLPRALLDVRPPGANADVLRTLVPVIEERHALAVGASPVTDAVRAHVAAALPRGLPALGDVARALAMSERSLQRALREEATSFAAIVDEVRRGIALTHLRGSTLGVGEIAFLAGFGEPASFFRAVRRWTGRTPGQLRDDDSA